MENSYPSVINAQLRNAPIAVVGMASVFPKARDIRQYWENIIGKVDCITDVPSNRWRIEDYYDPDPKKPDKTYCKRGGFIPDVNFDPLAYGLPPNILEVTDVSQLLALIVAEQALADGGYLNASASVRERTGVILGVVGGSMQLLTPLTARLQYPVWERVLKSSGLNGKETQQIIEKMKLAYVGWDENSFPGWLGNVIAGRIANRLDLGGINCVVDAACASSLAAVEMAISQLVQGQCDMIITGGVDVDNSALIYMSFSKTPAFSKSQHPSPFDAEADGMIAGEGLGMVVLKRLEDARRDGDRIYSIIRSIGTASDGKHKSIYAPRWEGQVKALERAYAQAGITSSSVGLIEAHGTGTMAGDACEFQALDHVFKGAGGSRSSIALGSVKSQIGHTKAAAGVAGLIKAILALHHKILPPTIHVNNPSPKFHMETSPLYLNTEARPWLKVQGSEPRRAGVSAFGFGGTNFHLVLEEHETEQHQPYRLHQSAQAVLLWAKTPEELLSRCTEVLSGLTSDARQYFAELVRASESQVLMPEVARVGFVADNPEQAQDLLRTTIEQLRTLRQEPSWEHPQGIFYRRSGMNTQGRVVALFSGQGSQYLEMGKELACNFPLVREAYSQLDQVFKQDDLSPVSQVVFPTPVFDEAAREVQTKALKNPIYAQGAIGAFSIALYRLLQRAGFKADFAAGHSFGELTALWAADVLSDRHYLDLVKARGQAMALPNKVDFDPGAMLAVKGDLTLIKKAIHAYKKLSIANFNAPNQVVLAGASHEIAQAQTALAEQGYEVVPLSVAAAFHTPLVAYAQVPFSKCVASTPFNPAQMPVYANSTGKPYPPDPESIRKHLESHITHPVRFCDEIENIYAAGGDIFIEFGPKNVITNLVKNILADRPHIAVALNPNRKQNSDRQLREAVVHLRVAGLPLQDLDPYQREAEFHRKQTTKGMNIPLNGSNHISEKTKNAFIQALSDGSRVETTKPLAPDDPKENLVVTGNRGNGSNLSSKTHNAFTQLHSNGSNGHRSEKAKPLKPSPPNLSTLSPSAMTNDAKPPVQPPRNSYPSQTESPVMSSIHPQHILESIEHTVSQFGKFQSDTLLVQREHNSQQHEYMQIFGELMQQQYALAGSAVWTESFADALKGLERSMSHFHNNQGETLKVHHQHLNQQVSYARDIFQMLQQQYALLKQRAFTPDAGQSPVSVLPRSRGEQLPSPTPTLLDISVSKPIEEAPSKNGFNKNGLSKNGVNGLEVSTSASQSVPSTPLHSLDELTQALLTVVAKKTGYPVEMLDMDMDMEADLSIDSIKRVEILSALPDMPRVQTADMGELQTLGQVVNYLYQQQTVSTPTTTLPATTITSGPVSASQSVLSTPLHSLDELTQALLTVVAKKTGYPVEMLDMDMDMEADLSIDSIKRVEILSALPDMPRVQTTDMGELQTLGQVVNYLYQQQTVSTPAVSAPPAAVSVSMTVSATDLSHQEALPLNGFHQGTPLSQEQPSDVSMISRQVVQLRPLQPPDFLELAPPEDHVLIITADGSQTTVEVARTMQAKGWKVVALHLPSSLIQEKIDWPTDIVRVNLANLSESHLEQQLSDLEHQYGPIGGFIHLNPIQLSEGQQGFLFEQERAILKHVFLIAKHLKPRLNRASIQEGRSCFITVARLDGAFGLGPAPRFGAISAGLFGLTKSLYREWEHVFCRALDLNPDMAADQVAQCILAEFRDPNKLLTEVGCTQKERSTLECKRTSAPHSVGDISSEAVFLVSGGGRGITAHCVRKLAATYHCRFILLGRSSLDNPEPSWAQGCSEEAELKKRIMEDLLAGGEKPTPAKIKSLYHAIIARREIEETLYSVEHAGGQAIYCCVDVREATQLQSEVQKAVAQLGPVTGIIHGAGNLADKLIEKKTVQDFDKVYGTKVTGLESLLACVPPQQLQYLVLFSSIVSFYGNAGQTDYALANEILNKMAHLIKRQYPACHVVALDWGPWESGMVTPELAKAFAERKMDIELIPVEDGCRMLIEELTSGNQDIAQVVIGSSLAVPPSPLDDNLRSYRIHRRLTREANPFLEDHQIGDQAVLPAMCASAWMINTCEQLYPEYRFFSRDNFQALKGIVFDKNLPEELILDLQETAKTAHGEIEFIGKLWSQGKNGRPIYHFSGQIKLISEVPDPVFYTGFDRSETLMLPCKSLYNSGAIFHGPGFQGLQCVLNANLEKVTIRCHLASLGVREQGQFPVQNFNPYLGDLQLQAMLLYLQYFYQEGCLPAQLQHFEQFRYLPFDQDFYISMEVRSKEDALIIGDIVSHDEQGQIYTRLMGAEMTVSKGLNELFAQSTSARMQRGAH
jgi:acyl transferase domain-containing protein/acyl carrier protein